MVPKSTKTVSVRENGRAGRPVSRRTRAPHDSVEEQIITAAKSCFAKFSIRKTTVEDICREAHISRTTFYKSFTSKNDVISMISFRETSIINKRSIEFQKGFDDIEVGIVESILYAIHLASNDPIIKFYLSPTENSGESVVDRSPEIWALQTEEWLPLYNLAHRAGRLRKGVTAESFARWITTVQYILLTRGLLMGEDESARRAMLKMFFIPSVLSDMV